MSDTTDTIIHTEDDPQDENGAGRPRAPVQAGLEQRLRAGSDSFAFDTLLAGVSTMNGMASNAVYDAPLGADDAQGIVPRASSQVVMPGPASLATRHGQELVPHAEHAFQIRPLTALALIVIVALATSISATALYLRMSGFRNTSQTNPSTNWVGRGLPNPALTPGERTSNRLLSFKLGDDLKQQVFTSYGLDPSDPKYRLCLLIPASLGGTTEPKNLFPATRWFADLKSRLDKQLTDEVAAGKLTDAQAEMELKTDWIRTMHRHKIRNYGLNDKKAADKVENTLNW